MADPLSPFHSAPAPSVGAPLPAEDAPQPAAPDDRYQPGNVLGEGGMGRVRVARDLRLRREVALKELAPGARAQEGADRRLIREAWITAQLDHPGIVAVHDLGTLADGRPFYTMRLVRGHSLAHAIEGCPHLDARLGLLRHFLSACEAVAYAHDAGVVHRDLKPANVMLGGFGETQVVDWGLASPTQPHQAAWARTLPDGVPVEAPAADAAPVGTPAYMSPEQAAGAPPDPRADVWSLGAMLYELLTGAPPWSGRGTQVLRQVRTDPLPTLQGRNLPPELVAIAERALARDPADRYADASALSADLARWLDGRPVHAYTYSQWELLLRVLRAWRIHLTVGSLAGVAVAVAVAVGWAQTMRERDLAVEAERRAMSALHHSVLERGRAAVDRDASAEAAELARQALALQDSPEARGLLATFAATPHPWLLDTRPLPDCPGPILAADASGLLCVEGDAVSLRDARTGQTAWTALLRARDGAISPLHDEVLVRTANGTTHRLDRATGRDHGALDATFGAWPLQVAGETVLVGNASRPFHVRGGQRHYWEDCPVTSAGALSPDGTRLALLCADGTLFLGRTGTEGATEAVPTSWRQASAVRWMPDGQRLVVGGPQGHIALLDAATGETLHTSTSRLGLINRLAVHPEGRTVAVLGSTGEVRLWSPQLGAWVASLPGTSGRTLAWDGDELVVAGQALRRWAVPEPGPPYRIPASAGLATLAVSPDGTTVALGGGDGALTTVRLTDGATERLEVSSGVLKAVAFTQDGQHLLLAGAEDVWLQVADRTGRHPRSIPGAPPLRRVRTSGSLLLGATYGPHVFVHDLQADRSGWVEGLDAEAIELSASATGFAILDALGQLYLLERPAPGAGSPVELPLHRLGAPVRGRTAVALSDDGGLVAVASSNAVTLLDPHGEVRLTLPAPGAGLRTLALSPDGLMVAGAGLDGTTRVWSTDDGRLLGALYGHQQRVAAVAFVPDGERLVTASWDATARIWELSALTHDLDGLLAR